jgi:hypothetical protein
MRVKNRKLLECLSIIKRISKKLGQNDIQRFEKASSCSFLFLGDVDLYVPGNGVWDITMKAIDCPSLKGTVGYIQFKFTGSNDFYFKLQARNTKYVNTL